MEENFTLFISHLSDDKTEEINFEADPAFMDVDEPVLKFTSPVSVIGQGYIAGEELILCLNLSTKAEIACSVCNEPVIVDVCVKNFYHTVPLEEVKRGEYNFSEAVREGLLLETPDFAECNGNCPARETLKSFIREPNQSDEDEGQRPFANL